MIRISLVCFILVSIYFYVFPAGNKEVKFKHEILGLQTVRNNEGYLGPYNIKFSMEDDVVYFINFEKKFGETEDKLFKYKYTDINLKEYIYGISEEDFTRNNVGIAMFSSVKIDKFYVIDEKILCVINKALGTKHSSNTLVASVIIDHLESGAIHKRIVQDKLPVFIQSTVYRELFLQRFGNSKNFSIYDYHTDQETKIEIDEKLASTFFNGGYFYLGRNRDELIISDSNDTSSLYFYNYVEEKILQKIQIPEAIESYTLGNQLLVLISPDTRYLCLYHYAYGLWLMDIETNEFMEVIHLKKHLVWTLHQVLAWDWSWDSKKIVLTIDDDIFILNIEKFLASEPERMTPTVIYPGEVSGG